MSRVTLKDRGRDWVAILATEPGKWAPGSSRLEAVTELIRRFPNLSNTPCSLCGQPVGTENVIADDSGYFAHLACFHQEIEQLL